MPTEHDSSPAACTVYSKNHTMSDRESNERTIGFV